MIKITIAQIKPKLGDALCNAEKILSFYSQSQGDITLFPELSLTGYIPKDLLLYPKFLLECITELNKILPFIKQRVCVVGIPLYKDGKLYNASLALQNGKIIATSTKSFLPNYSVFDEKRYFAKGETATFEYMGIKFGLPICEDIWFGETSQNLKHLGVDVCLVLNASPFCYDKIHKRMEVAKTRFAETGIPIIYCNQVLCQDGILYDGTSFAFDGKNTIFCSSFKEEALEITFNDKHFSGFSSNLLSKEELTYQALVFGLKEYVLMNGFKKVVLGFSGGADSALVLVLAVKAFGVGNVKAVLMPSRFTSKESFDDAKNLVSNLGVSFEEISIEKPLQAFSEILTLEGLSFENIQARIRANILMAISNKEGSLVLTTGNKSEMAVGYCTLYGDMCGAYNPIKDLYKTEVFEVMKYINKAKIAQIPKNIITKAPSAELRENQKDSDTLPPYEVLDKILYELIENKKLPEEIEDFDGEMVNKVSKLFYISEYKRRQSPPGTKLSIQSFEPCEWRRNIKN